jgi:hypothetical protein
MRLIKIFLVLQFIVCGNNNFSKIIDNDEFINLINSFIDNKITTENMLIPKQKEGYITYYGGGVIIHISNYENYKPDYIDEKIKYKDIYIIQNFNETKSCATYEINTIVSRDKYSFSILQYVPTYDKKCPVNLKNNNYYLKDNPQQKSIELSKRLIDFFEDKLM